jgi:hypothetical protein
MTAPITPTYSLLAVTATGAGTTLALPPGVSLASCHVMGGANYTGESYGTGDGTTVTFAHTASHLAVVPGSITIKVATVAKGTDDGYGTISGATVSGTVDYSTGVMSVTFTTAPAGSAAITVDYSGGTSTSSVVFEEADSVAGPFFTVGSAVSNATGAGSVVQTATPLQFVRARVASLTTSTISASFSAVARSSYVL